MNDADVAAICAVGPSLPPEPPEPMVIADAIILTGMARSRIPAGSVLIARIATSVPCPSVSGATRKTSKAGYQRSGCRQQRDRPQPA